MALVDLDLGEISLELPEEAEHLIRDAEARVEAFIERRLGDPIVGFVPSDFRAVYGALAKIVGQHLAPGPLFCEWGSGFGVVALLAALLEFDVCGIEIEQDLVTASRRLAADHGLAAEFVCGSFIPPGGEDVADRTNEFAWLRTDARSAYDELGLDARDFDVVFAYPWPGEEGAIHELFDRYGAQGALIVTFQGVEAVRVRRRT